MSIVNRTSWKGEGHNQSDVSTNQGTPKAANSPQKRHGTGLPLVPSEETNSVDTLTSDL